MRGVSQHVVYMLVLHVSLSRMCLQSSDKSSTIWSYTGSFFLVQRYDTRAILVRRFLINLHMHLEFMGKLDTW